MPITGACLITYTTLKFVERRQSWRLFSKSIKNLPQDSNSFKLFTYKCIAVEYVVVIDTFCKNMSKTATQPQYNTI